MAKQLVGIVDGDMVLRAPDYGDRYTRAQLDALPDSGLLSRWPRYNFFYRF